MLVRLNQVLGRMMPLITPFSVLLGVLLAAYLKDFTFLVPWVFAVMTFAGVCLLLFGFKAYGDAPIAFDFIVYDFTRVDASLCLVSGTSHICG